MQVAELIAAIEGLRADIEKAINILDRLDGDPDFEELGLEDSFEDHAGKFDTEGAGCPVADPGGPGWVERTNQTQSAYGGHSPSTLGCDEDAEDDDPDCGSDEGEPNFAPLPRSFDNGPGCLISDSDYGGEEAGEADGL